ncbi:hypothetical protein V2J09_023913 [Rumex salicifolius]
MDYIRRKIKSQSTSRSIPSGKLKKNGNGALRSKLDVNEEYNEVFRSKSYIDISSKVEEQLMRRLSISSMSPSSSSSPLLPFYDHLSDCILEPSQEAAMKTVKSSAQYSILMEYYNTSLDACNLCELVLRRIHKTRSHYKHIQKAIKIASGDIQAKEFDSFSTLTDPLSIVSSEKFSEIHNNLSHLLTQLTTRHKKMRKKMKRIKLCKKVLGYGLMASYGVFAVALLVFAVHSILGLVGIPGLIMLCPLGVAWKKTKTGRDKLKSSVHERICGQLDMAARGVYILINQLDTIGRLVERLENEIEHKKAIAGMCVRSYERSQEVPCEALRELKLYEDGFLEQIDELEKQVYFCVLGMNKSRRLVIQETIVT